MTEKFVLIDQDNGPTVHQVWGDGLVIIGAAVSQQDGEKIVDHLNRLAAASEKYKSRLRLRLSKTVNKAINEILRDL